MNDNTKGVHVPRQGVDHLPGQLDLIEHAKLGEPHVCESKIGSTRCDRCFAPLGEKPFEDLGPNVSVLPVATSHDLPVARILQGAHDADLEVCVVVGYDKDGEEYFASSVADGAEVNWCLDRAKLKLLNMVRSDPVGEMVEPPTKA